MLVPPSLWALLPATLIPLLGDYEVIFAVAAAGVVATQYLPAVRGMAMANQQGPVVGRREIDELKQRASEAHAVAQRAAGRMDTHEAVCAERYGNLRNDMDELKGFMRWALRGGVVALAGLVGDIILHLAKIGGG